MKKALLISLTLVFAVASIAAFAAPTTPTDTISTTAITAAAADNTLNYNNSGDNPQPEVTPVGNIVTTVLPIYGFQGLNAPADQTTTPGAIVHYLYVVTNEGNVEDTYDISLGTASYTGGASAWTFATSVPSVTLAEDADGTFTVDVTPAPATSPNGSTGIITVTVTTDGTPVGAYTGANGNEYGGVQSAADETITHINAAVMTMSRVATVDAPVDYRTLNGEAKRHDAVPGAVITYTLSVSNEGSDTAKNVVIIDKNPLYGISNAGGTSGFHVGGTGTTPSALVDITAAGATAAGWNAYYTVNAAPSFAYVGTANATWILVSGNSIPANARFVKFEKAAVDAGENGTLTWGVVIN